MPLLAQVAEAVVAASENATQEARRRKQASHETQGAGEQHRPPYGRQAPLVAVLHYCQLGAAHAAFMVGALGRGQKNWGRHRRRPRQLFPSVLERSVMSSTGLLQSRICWHWWAIIQ